MKKLLTSLVAIAVLGTMTFCVTGCGSDKTDNADVSQTSSVSETSEIDAEATEKETEEATEEATEEVTEEDDSESNSGKMTLEEFVSSDVVQNYVDTTNETQTDITMDIKADGDTLIYECTFNETIEDEALELVKEELESSMEQSKSTYTNLITSMEDAVDVENPSVMVKYLNTDGSVIYEVEYTAE